MNEWYEISKTPPPQGVNLNTKIADDKGERNEAILKKSGNLWFSDGVYVYYTPTHWQYV